MNTKKTPASLGLKFLIELSAENVRLKARIAELEAELEHTEDRLWELWSIVRTYD